MKRKPIIFLLVFSLMGLTLMNIPSPKGDIVFEDFTTFTEYDPNEVIDIINSTLINANVSRGYDEYVYKDYGVEYFENFTHTLDGKFGQDLNIDSICFPQLLSNDIDDAKGLTNNNKDFIGFYSYDFSIPPPTPTQTITLRECDAGTSYINVSSVLSNDVWYYFRFHKNGTYLNLAYWTNGDDRDNNNRTAGSYVEDLTLNLQHNYKFRYLFVVNTWNTGINYRTKTYIRNLWIGTEGYFVTFYRSNGGILRVNDTTVSNGTQTEYLNGTILELAGLTSNASFVWLNFTWDSYNATSNPFNLTVTSNATVWCYFSVAPEGYAGFSFLFFGLIIGVIVGAILGYGSKK